MLLGESEFLSDLFRISAEKQSPSAITDISIPGVSKAILTKVIQYLYQVFIFLNFFLKNLFLMNSAEQSSLPTIVSGKAALQGLFTKKLNFTVDSVQSGGFYI